MKLTNLLFLTIISTTLFTACDTSSNERHKAAGEKLTAVVQKGVGNITNDQELKNASKKNELKSDLRSTKEDIKDVVTGK